MGQSTVEAHLKATIAITLGGQPISLPSGTCVKVLQKTPDKAIISLTLGDGTPVITQVATYALDFPAPGPPISAASSPDKQKVAPSADVNVAPPASERTESSSPATIIPTDSTTANKILKSPDTSPSNSVSRTSPAIDPAVIISHLGVPLQVTQPDFPEPDPNLQPKQFSVDIPDHPEMRGRANVVYTIPLDKDGNPGPRAQHTVFYCPYFREAKPLDEKVCKFLSGNLGFTVISVEIKWDNATKTASKATAAVSDDNNIAENIPASATTIDNLTNSLYTYQALYSQIAFEAQSLIEIKYQFKHEPLAVIGLSSGSDMAERMAVHFQDKMACVVLMSGGHFESPFTKLNIPCFIMYSRGDGNGSANEELIGALQNLGTRPIHLTIEPRWDNPNWDWRGGDQFHHVISDDGFNLCEAYIWDVVQQMESSHLSLLKSESWPYVSTRAYPANVYNNNSSMLPALPNNYFPLPGITSAFYYLKLQSHQLTTSTNYKSSLWSIDSMTKPKGLIIYSDNFSYLSIERIIDDMYYFADNGYSVIYTKGNSIDVPDLLSWIQADPQKRDLPLYAIAFKEQAAAYLKLAQTDLKGKFKSLALINYAFDDVTQSPLQLKQPETDCPVLYIFDSTLAGLPDGKLREIQDYAQNPPPKDFNSTFILIEDPEQSEDFSAQRAVPSIKNLFDGSQ